jgi:hypothetical protein
MLILLLPVTTLCVAVLGFYVWHRQLARKRLFEVADAALSAFSRAEAALVQARSSAGFGFKAEYLTQHNDAFDELERAAFAVEVHFGEEIANEIRGPLRAYNRIILAASLPGAVSDRLRQRLIGHAENDRRIDVYAPSNHVAISKANVRNALRPWLVPPSIGEFLRVRDWLSSAQRQAAKLVRRHRGSRGCGKVAVYALSPPTNDRRLPDLCSNGTQA